MSAAIATEFATRETILSWLAEVMDPEVPVVSVLDLGIVRDVQWLDDVDSADHAATLQVTVTPTYSGCPATEVIAESIRQALYQRGITQVQVRTQLSPAWTTDWMTTKGKEALRGYGIAPPVQMIDASALLGKRAVVPCPQCASRKTRLLSQFGSTACKALYQCQDCLEPFDYFKPH
ncbi:MAG: phenylacetate-CoA oxygenase subunit PaaJ [Cytophagales bacterium]|nr:phenylacetate-CoA oxygenase subunit PaaJ [Cytophagales bacterium]